MSDDEPKTAVEIAMEKLRARDDSEQKPLSEEQKKQIAEIRVRYRAKVAELEIHQEAKLRLAASADEVDKLRGELNAERERLNREMEGKVLKVRGA